MFTEPFPVNLFTSEQSRRNKHSPCPASWERASQISPFQRVGQFSQFKFYQSQLIADRAHMFNICRRSTCIKHSHLSLHAQGLLLGAGSVWPCWWATSSAACRTCFYLCLLQKIRLFLLCRVSDLFVWARSEWIPGLAFIACSMGYLIFGEWKQILIIRF